jgi:16S rRNA (uracil1498-N3)-methyltransferase
MTRRRFYAPPGAFDSNLETVTLGTDEARHLRDVLRLKVGDKVYVFNGVGKEFHCRIEESRRDSARLTVVGEVDPARPESPLHLTLAVALLKGEKFDLMVQKATELGVARVVPVVTKLADIRLRDESDTAKRVARWQRIALEAAKQSGRAVVPEVSSPVTFQSLVQKADDALSLTSAAPSLTSPPPSLNSLLFSERDGRPLREAVDSLVRTASVRGRLNARGPLDADEPPAHAGGSDMSLSEASSLTALVGSEGGWTDEELAAAREAGWQIVTLGGRTLRAETAAIAVAVLLQHLAGDLV